MEKLPIRMGSTSMVGRGMKIWIQRHSYADSTNIKEECLWKLLRNHRQRNQMFHHIQTV